MKIFYGFTSSLSTFWASVGCCVAVPELHCPPACTQVPVHSQAPSFSHDFSVKEPSLTRPGNWEPERAYGYPSH